MTDLLGPDHERVKKAHDKLALSQAYLRDVQA
jgi:hypothetical protein